MLLQKLGSEKFAITAGMVNGYTQQVSDATPIRLVPSQGPNTFIDPVDILLDRQWPCTQIDIGSPFSLDICYEGPGDNIKAQVNEYVKNGVYLMHNSRNTEGDVGNAIGKGIILRNSTTDVSPDILDLEDDAILFWITITYRVYEIIQ